MRNCFVPNCDAISRDIAKRMMFMPPKNEEHFKLWQEALPKKKILKKQDRVCERHFNKSDISTTWDHVINGVLHQLERGKPKLRPNAVPKYNLNIDSNEKKANTNDLVKRIKRRVEEPNKVDGNDEINANVSSKKQKTKNLVEEVSIVSDLTITNIISNNHCTTDDNNKPIEIDDELKDGEIDDELKDGEIDSNELNDTLFECIYEDAFEVELPTTLWAMHRDPNRQFIAFSMYDAMAMRSSRVLHVSNKLETKVFIFNENVSQTKHKTLTIENLTDILNEMNDYRICQNYTLAKKFPITCDILLTGDMDLCVNCTNITNDEFLFL